jgi:hypothetical protein
MGVIERSKRTKAKPKPSRENMKSCSSKSKIWGTQDVMWTSEGLGSQAPMAVLVAVYMASLRLAVLAAYSSPWHVLLPCSSWHLTSFLVLSSILSSASEGLPSGIRTQAFLWNLSWSLHNPACILHVCKISIMWRLRSVTNWSSSWTPLNSDCNSLWVPGQLSMMK